MGGAAHNCRRAAYAAAPAGAAGTDRLFPREAGCRRLRPRSPVEQQQEQQGGVQVEQQAGEGGELRAAQDAELQVAR